jgi:hypothetical protein
MQVNWFTRVAYVAPHSDGGENVGQHRVLEVSEAFKGRPPSTIEVTTSRRTATAAVDEVVDYENIYRLCYIRGPEGILIGLAQQLGQQASRENPMEKQ